MVSLGLWAGLKLQVIGLVLLSYYSLRIELVLGCFGGGLRELDGLESSLTVLVDWIREVKLVSGLILANHLVTLDVLGVLSFVSVNLSEQVGFVEVSLGQDCFRQLHFYRLRVVAI